MDHVLITQDNTPVGQIPLGGGRGYDYNFVIGRTQQTAICLPHLKISKQHAVLQRSGGVYWLRDLGSTNGTHLNGARLASGQAAAVYDGDVAIIGPFGLLFRLPGFSRESVGPGPGAGARGRGHGTGAVGVVSSATIADPFRRTAPREVYEGPAYAQGPTGLQAFGQPHPYGQPSAPVQPRPQVHGQRSGAYGQAQAYDQAGFGPPHAHGGPGALLGQPIGAAGRPPPPPARLPGLEIWQGRKRIRRHELADKVTAIGRMALCQITLAGTGIPPEKARLERGPDGFVLENCVGPDSILVGDTDAVGVGQKRPLRDGEWFRLGEYTLRLDERSEPEGERSAPRKQASDRTSPWVQSPGGPIPAAQSQAVGLAPENVEPLGSGPIAPLGFGAGSARTKRATGTELRPALGESSGSVVAAGTPGSTGGNLRVLVIAVLLAFASGALVGWYFTSRRYAPRGAPAADASRRP